MIRSATELRARAARTLIVFSLGLVALLAAASPAAAIAPSANGCTLTLSPATADRVVGQQHTVTAVITADNPQSVLAAVVPGPTDTWNACHNGQIYRLAGSTVTFTIVSGPHAGQTADVALDTSGTAQFTYTGTATGTDQIEATYTMPLLDNYCYDTAVSECDVTVGAQVQANWTAPVVAQADPSVSVASFKRCVSHKFTINPSYSNGTVQSSTLFVDGRKRQTRTDASAFTVNPQSYKAGKHNFEVVTVFTNGKSASKFGSFSRCKVRVTRAKVAPKFTG